MVCSSLGTPTFMAPEMYETEILYDFKVGATVPDLLQTDMQPYFAASYTRQVDIYAFGMVMLEICTGKVLQL